MSGWLDTLSPGERTEWDAFVEHFRRDTLEKLAGSALVMSLIPKTGFDVKFAVELGAAIMLDKPILAVVPAGQRIPAKLRQVADEIVDADIDVADGQRRVAAALERLVREQKETTGG